MSADPLSFFARNDDEESDESDSENSSDADNTEEALDNTNINKLHNENNLPPPLLALANAKTPEFVTSHVKNDLNWDEMVKEAPYVPPKEFKPWENVLPSVEAKSTVKSKKPDLAIVKGAPHTLTAAPPKIQPKSEQVRDVKDHALTWSKMYKDSGFSSASAKRPRPEDEDADLAGFCHTDVNIGKNAFQTKHQKTNASTYREKEKRKRDTGQANRDKSFVEEEKRILKQNFDD